MVTVCVSHMSGLFMNEALPVGAVALMFPSPVSAHATPLPAGFVSHIEHQCMSCFLARREISACARVGASVFVRDACGPDVHCCQCLAAHSI